MPTKIGGFVLRCIDKKITKDFYTKLGLTATEHQHPGGPIHVGLEPLADKKTEFAVELYNASAPYIRDAVMLEVDSIDRALAIAKDFGIEPKMHVKIRKDFSFVYIDDPDGRDVMLIEKNKPEKLVS